MKFSDTIEQASELLRDSRRITDRALKQQFDVDEEALDDFPQCSASTGQGEQR